MEEDDAALVRLALGGDGEAFECLVGRHAGVARRVAYLHAPAADVEDVVQEAFVRAWHELARLRAGEGFRSWLVAIVANQARNRRRGEDRRLAWEERAPVLRPPRTPDEEAVSNDELAGAMAAVAALREPERDVVAYRYFLDLSEAETAAALGVPVGTVKSRLSRALDRLRVTLGANP